MMNYIKESDIYRLVMRSKLPELYRADAGVGQQGKGESTLRVWMNRGYVEWDEIACRFINKKIKG